MILYLLRGGFILLATSVMCLYLLSSQYDLQLDAGGISLSIGFTVGACLTIIAIDIFTRRQKLAALSGIFLGLLAGLVLAYALSFVVDLVGLLFAPGEDGARRAAFFSVLEGVKVFIGLITCYMGISLVLQTKDDFRFVIPYVEFAKQYRERRPTFVDTSALIDGRIEELIAANVIPRPLIVPTRTTGSSDSAAAGVWRSSVDFSRIRRPALPWKIMPSRAPRSTISSSRFAGRTAAG